MHIYVCVCVRICVSQFSTYAHVYNDADVGMQRDECSLYRLVSNSSLLGFHIYFREGKR